MKQEELIEQLADKEHASWARWMQYLFEVCEAYSIVDSDGFDRNKGVLIPPELVEQWQRQIDTPYAELEEKEKQSCRCDVSYILPIIDDHAGIDPDTAITAFMGWLTSRDEVSGPFSSRHDAAGAVWLIKKFCEAQGWHASSDRFHQQIKLLKMNYPGKECPLCDDW